MIKQVLSRVLSIIASPSQSGTGVYGKKKRKGNTQTDSRRYEMVGRGFCRATFLTAFYSFPCRYSRDRVFHARVKFTPRFRENERREKGERIKKRGGRKKKRGKAATRLLLCKLRRRVKVCLQSARARCRTALEMDKDLEDRSALARRSREKFITVDHVGPAFSRIVSRRGRRDWHRRDYDVCETLANIACDCDAPFSLSFPSTR